MKVIDLLNRCLKKDETLPRVIKFQGIIFRRDFNNYQKGNFYYEGKYQLEYINIMEMINTLSDLQKEIEIIEEEKDIEELDIKQEKNIKNNWKWKIKDTEHDYNISTPQKIMCDKINELIREVNKLKKEDK